MAKQQDQKPDQPSGSSFLGGGPKFNTAGHHVPLPGEKIADVPPPPPLGGPRVWIGVLAVVVLIAVLWSIYGGGIPGTQSRTGHGISIDSQPSANPDAPSNAPP